MAFNIWPFHVGKREPKSFCVIRINSQSDETLAITSDESFVDAYTIAFKLNEIDDDIAYVTKRPKQYTYIVVEF